MQLFTLENILFTIRVVFHEWVDLVWSLRALLGAGLEWRSKTTPSLHQSEGSPWASVSTLVPPYLGLQVQTSAAGCLVVHTAEELIPSQWHEHQMACGRASSEANGWHQPASELLLRLTSSLTLYVAHLCTLYSALRTREAV